MIIDGVTDEVKCCMWNALTNKRCNEPAVRRKQGWPFCERCYKVYCRSLQSPEQRKKRREDED